MKFIIFATAIVKLATAQDQACAGVGGLACPKGFTCQVQNEYPDQLGTCIPQTCGTQESERCPEGFVCDRQGGSSGVCREHIYCTQMIPQCPKECPRNCEIVPQTTFTCSFARCPQVCNKRAPCPKDLTCMDRKGNPAVRGTCRQRICPVVKCQDPCLQCPERKCAMMRETFFDDGCKGCPVGIC
jgi:hypothetical protein